MEKLRGILLGCPFSEQLKWGKPCYTFQGTNVVLIVGFKEHCALIVCKGALLKDGSGILIKAGENTQAARQIRFNSLREIEKLEQVLKAYMQEAIAAEKAGLQVEFKAIAELVYADELQAALEADPALQKAFEALTPGRKRAYNMFFSEPKQTKTRVARIEKCVPQILEGKGLHDEYRSTRK